MPPSDSIPIDPAGGPLPGGPLFGRAGFIPPPQGHLSPVERFLGPAALGGPFGLLGVPPSFCTDSAIVVALQSRLAAIASHPQSMTPEADEVRLALHAAAAQLLNPQVRAKLIEQFAHVPVVPVTVSPTISPAQVSLEQDALMTLGAMGGWNQQALHQLAMMAHARGLSSDSLATVLGGLTRRSLPQPPPAAPPSPFRRPAAVPAPAPVLEQDVAMLEAEEKAGASIKFWRDLGLVAAIAVVGIGLVSGGLWLALRSSSKPAAVVDAGPDVLDEPTKAVEAPKPLFADRPKPVQPPPVAPAPEVTDPVRALRAAISGLDIDPDVATRKFEEAVRSLSLVWPNVSSDQLSATQDAVVEFIYRAAAHPELAKRALAGVVAPAAIEGAGAGPLPPRILPSAWSSGMLARLARERDIPAALRWQLDSALQAAGDISPSGGGTFEQGAQAALAAWVTRLLPEPNLAPEAALEYSQAWVKWADATDAACRGDETRRVRSHLTALERLLLEAPEPTQSKATYESIMTLVSRLSFAAKGPAQDALLRWFNAPAVSAPDLFAVTKAVAERPATAGGIDTTLVVAATATESSREELRQRYVRVWGLDDTDEKEAAVPEWVNAAKRALQPEESAIPPVTALARAVRFSRLSEAAAALWAGDSAEGLSLVGRSDEPLDRVRDASQQQGPAVMYVATDGSDGQWGASYKSAGGSVPARTRLLHDLQLNEIGPADAFVLASECTRGSPPQVARLAREVARGYDKQAVMINALLEQAATMPRSAEISTFLESMSWGRLPPTDDPSWRASVRRVLVERLLTLLTTKGGFGLIDHFAEDLADSCRSRAGLLQTAPSAQPPPKPAETTPTSEVPGEKEERKPADTPEGDAPAGTGAAPPENEEAASDPTAASNAAESRVSRALLHSQPAAQALRGLWRRAADRVVPTGKEVFSLADIERRAAARAALARGPVQAFAAEQLASTETMAFVVVAENPARADAVRAVLDELAQARRQATDLLVQIQACERAALSLWLIRFGESAT